MTEFEDLLKLTSIEGGVWTAPTPAGSARGNLYGGIVAAQALVAGHAGVDGDRQPSSMHAYFLRSGTFDEPVELQVHRIRDGRSFSSRRIEVVQSGGPILTMLATFQVPEEGDSYQIEAPALDPPSDATPALPTGHETGMEGEGPFEVVEVEPGPRREGSREWAPVRLWCRSRGRLGSDPVIHAGAMVAMGDLRTGNPLLMARADDGEVQMTSLDYSVWFHRPVRADEWLLFDIRAGGNGGARGLSHGVVHDSEGVHVASFAMELLLRTRRTGPQGQGAP